MDDELNILPTSTRVKDIKPIARDEDGNPVLPAKKTTGELKELFSSLQDTMVIIVHLSEDGRPCLVLKAVCQTALQVFCLAIIKAASFS